MVAQPRPLIEVLAEIPDVRSTQGSRHPLAAILALVCSALLCGDRRSTAIAEWGRNYGARLTQALGFPRQPPCAATRHAVLKGVDREALEAHLGTWAEGLLAVTSTSQKAPEGIASAGKTLRGSQKQGAPGAPLLSALGHRLGLTRAQQAVADTTNERSAVMTWRRQGVLEGRVVPMEALLTQRPMAPQIVAAGGAYVMVVKNNQPQLRDDSATVFALPPIATERRTVAETVDSGHGRIEQRRLETSAVLVGDRDWPGLAPGFHWQRQGVSKKTGAVREEAVFGVTSLAPERANAAHLLALVRGHWQIENQSHWVRDVTFDEDRSTVRCGNLPQVMAALRNTVIRLMRRAGETNMAAACRRFAAQPMLALARIGVELEN